MPDQDVLRAARLAGYGTVSTRLSLLSDHRLGEVVAAATPLGSGIGGRSAELDVNGTRVFVKRIPLTDTELPMPDPSGVAAATTSPSRWSLAVQKSLTVDRAGRTRMRWRDTRRRADTSTTVRPISMISLRDPGGGCPFQQVASTSMTFSRADLWCIGVRVGM
ncbi:hypothetical protein SNARM312S_02254 [Streptomyces narbonensis]